MNLPRARRPPARRGQARPGPLRLQRPAQRGRDHRRPAHPPAPRDPDLVARPRRRKADGVQPPGPAQGQAGPQVLDGPGAPAPLRAAGGPRAPTPAGSSCWRTCATTPARRPTTLPLSPRWSKTRTSTSTTLSAPPTGRTPRSSGRPPFLPSAAGRVLAREVEVLDGLLQKPERPFVAVLGRGEGLRQARA